MMHYLLLCFMFVYAEAMASESSTSLVEIYRPFLENVPEDPSKFNPYLGGQRFENCCLLAVSESLFIDNETLYIRPGQTFFRGSMTTLEKFPSFPCAASFNGSIEGPPQDFWTPYSWCRRRCPGWQATSPSTYGNWLKPMSAFILPSLVFCLTIPRRRRIEIPRPFITGSSGGILGVLFYAFKLPAAFAILIVDILIWLSVVFSISGPILVSSIYEALLDARILRFLQRRLRSNCLSIRSRAHLLLVVILGNLDFEPAWHHSKLIVQCLSKDPPLIPITSPTTPPSAPLRGSPWIDNSTSYYISAVKSKLHAILNSQPNFGGTVGAPVLFYMASFIWSVYEIQASYGSYQSAHQISFGLLWMTIPHIALVTSLLLAGSNTSVFQSSISPSTQPGTGTTANVGNLIYGSGAPAGFAPVSGFGVQVRRYLFHLRKVPLSLISIPDTSPYRAAWVWNRGMNKARWISKLADEEDLHLDALHQEILGHRSVTILWYAGFWAFVLIFIPVFFAGIVSYHTPSVGLGCWSLAMLCYGAAQLLLIILWLISMFAWQWSNDGKLKHDVALAQQAGTWGGYIWYFSFSVSVCISVFMSVGGTIFIMTGLFSNCLCFTPARYWYNITTNPDATIFWNSATDTQLYYSQKWWFPAGIVGTVFMAVIAYLGWWYQKHLRSSFHNLVDRISDVDEKHWRESTGVNVNRSSANP